MQQNGCNWQSKFANPCNKFYKSMWIESIMIMIMINNLIIMIKIMIMLMIIDYYKNNDNYKKEIVY